MIRFFVLAVVSVLAGCESSPYAYREVTIHYPNTTVSITGYCAVGVGRYDTGGLADVVDCIDNGQHVTYVSPHMSFKPSQYTIGE